MDIKLLLAEFYELYKFLGNNSVPMNQSSQYPRLCNLADEILDYYKLPHEQKFYNILIEFTIEETLSPITLDFVDYKLKISSTKVQGGLYKIDRVSPLGQPQPIVSKEVWGYVQSQLKQHISHHEFVQIENGIRMMWNYSRKELLVSTDFIHAVDRYLSSMEIPYDRTKMIKVVELVLEYLEELGYWNGFPF